MKLPDYIKMQKLVEKLAKGNPELGLTFGYIGNLDRRWGDDRSWFVFTLVQNPWPEFISTDRHKYFIGNAENLEEGCGVFNRRLVWHFVNSLKEKR